MDKDFEERLKRTMEAAPRIPGLDWNMVLSVSMLRELEERQPGFTAAVKARIERSAANMEASDDPDQLADAPSVRELLASWIFTE